MTKFIRYLGTVQVSCLWADDGYGNLVGISYDAYYRMANKGFYDNTNRYLEELDWGY